MRKLFMILVAIMACTWSLQAQTRTYLGSVVDAANGEPLIGATVLPIGGGNGVATDVEGNFQVTVPERVHTARVSYVGYEEQTVTLSDHMVIALKSTSTNLDDVVVVAYGTANKESLTGSVAVVGSQQIEDRPVTSVTAALEGNAPGVQVNNSTGTPGSSPTIRIRGFNSFKNNAPLYVVDGIVYDGEIADLNPADIESMSVLKDAASCALYGNRGANGVILITTKRAKSAGKVDVTLQVRQGMYNRGLPFYDTMGADQWMETSLLGWAHGRYTGKAFSSVEDAIKASGPAFVNSYLNGTNPYVTPEGVELFSETGKLQGYIPSTYTDLDWWKAVSRSGHRQEYNVSATGATEKFNVFTSVGYLKENGYMLQTDFERFTGRLTANYTPTSYLKIGANLAASYQDTEVGGADPDDLGLVTNPFQVNKYAPIIPYYQHNDKGEIEMQDGKPVWNTSGLLKGNNIAWSMRLDQSNYKTLNVNASLYGTVMIPYGFELTVRGNMYRSSEMGTDYSNNIIGSLQGSGGIDVTNVLYSSHTFMQTLTWNHDYGKNHVDVLLDHENYQYGYDYRFLRKSGQLLPDNITLNNFESDDASSEGIIKLRTESYLGRARYNFEQKYFGEVSFRRDGTSRFSKENRWGNFWSVGASWIITKEKFMDATQNWLNYLKLRAAYGSVGNDAAAGAYAYWALYTNNWTYDGTGTLIPYQLAANNIRWESTKTLDVALEGSLFNDRFTFSVGYFDKRNADLLYNVTRPFSAGTVNNFGALPNVLSNVGTMSNRGWELQFGVDIIRNQEFKWDFSVDAAFVKNKIVKLPNNQNIVGQALFQGYSLYEHYNVEWAGVDMRTGNSLYYMNPNSPDFFSYDTNGKLTYNAALYEQRLNQAIAGGYYFEKDGVGYTTRPQYAGRKIMGTSLPTVYGSFGTNLSWKGINLGLLFTYSLGGKTYNGVYQELMTGVSTNSPGALHKDLAKSWTESMKTEEFIINKNGVPVLDTELSQFNNYSSSRFLVSNNYLTLKNINLTYDFPRAWVDALRMTNLNLGVSIDNLFIITTQKGLNPTYGFAGGQGNYYVPARVFSFQLTAKF